MEKSGTLLHNTLSIVVVCGKDALALKTVQLEGRCVMSAEEFCCGYKGQFSWMILTDSNDL